MKALPGRFYREDTGPLGENIAVRYLRSRGLRIISKNYRCPLGEIDIVALERDAIVFFEVKTRYSEKYGPPLESITRDKRRRIVRNCLFYLKKHGKLDAKCRIDAIGILLDRGGDIRECVHVKNAILMED